MLHILITAGQEKGKSLEFDQLAVTLGRTSDNDLVLVESGVSRKHARLFQRAGSWNVEDSGSANGTMLNGQPLNGSAPLKTGDKVAVGPVEFTVTVNLPEDGLEPPDSGLSTRLVDAEAPPLEQSTRIVSASAVAQDPAARVKTGQMGAVPPRRTGAQPVLAAAGNGPSRPAIPASPSKTTHPRPAHAVVSGEAEAATGEVDDEATGAGAPGNLPVRPGPGGRPAPPRARTSAPQEAGDALERLRARREHGDSVGGQLALAWGEAPPAKKALAVVMGLLLLGGSVAGVVYVYRPTAFGPSIPEPMALGRDRITHSFGYGDEVDFRRVDEKSFDFEYTNAGRAVAVLHYSARSISEREVNIVLNGVIQGQVPPDTLEPDREYEQVFAARDLRNGQKNTLSFDNVKNPPGREAWAVYGILLEVIPIPDAPEEQLAVLASESARKASQFYDLREVGPENLFRAWKTFRFAWLYMEAMTNRPELYSLVRDRYQQVSRELDNQCARLLLAAQKAVQLKNPARADKALERVITFFPTNEHRCNAQS
ncbi:MAG: FHA domain-containing protein, partial [Deltaproteobacteria bacterium]|nr:FHA domain-containing protein [Deltaproteobacteria bacterium]